MYGNVALPDVYRPDIQLINNSGHYLVGLINDILDLSKVEAGKFELHPENVDLANIFRGVLATAVGLLKDKPLQLRPDYAEDLPRVWADPLRVRQIILNLLSNAIKFTDSGSITLKAAVTGQFVKISVTDTGIGIPQSALASIFDRFEQAQQDSDKHYGGTGLGLDISKQLAQMHGGEMTVKSVVNQGSTFAFTLPISASGPATVEEVPASADVDLVLFNASNVSVAETYTILLVEDEVSTCNMLRRGLESEGYIVIDSNTGEQAFDIAIGILPSAITLDVRLPDMDGWEILKRLKATAETSAIPTIMCTVDEDREQAFNLGASAYLHKPVTISQVLTEIQKVVALSSSIENGA